MLILGFNEISQSPEQHLTELLLFRCSGLQGRGSTNNIWQTMEVAQTISHISRVMGSDAFSRLRFYNLGTGCQKIPVAQNPSGQWPGGNPMVGLPALPSEKILHGASHRSPQTTSNLSLSKLNYSSKHLGLAFSQLSQAGIYDLCKIDDPKRICGNFAEFPHPMMPGAMLCCWGTPEMGFAMVNWAPTTPAGNYVIPIADTDSIALGNYSFWDCSYGRELWIPISKGGSGLVCFSHPLPAASLPPSAPGKPKGWIHGTHPLLLSLLLECLSSHRCTGVNRKLQKILALKPEENNHRVTLLSLSGGKAPYILTKTCHSMWQ